MAKSRKNRGGRDLSNITRVNLSRPRPALGFAPLSLSNPPLLKPAIIEDRRLFHFEGRLRPALAVKRVATRLVASPRNPLRVQFAGPQLVSICIKRKARRSVLFAIKKNGRNGQTKSRRNFFSSVGC